LRYVPPQVREGVRVDTGVDEGGEVSMHYDPMIAKLVAHGADREQAIARMLDALDRFFVRGLAHNIGFLTDIIAGPHFAAGELSTNLIGREYPEGFDPASKPLSEPDLFAAIAASVHARCEARPFGNGSPSGARESERALAVVMRGERLLVHTEPVDGGHLITCDGVTYRVTSGWHPGQPLFLGAVNGDRLCVQVERDGLRYRLFHGGCQVDALVVARRAAELLALMPERSSADQSSYLLSPMPGLLTRLLVAPGDEVVADQCVAIIEAMKMENALRVERPGKIAEILVAAGDSLAVDQPILQFECAA
jgi:propionyl-CoA carboxylase alpha chain